MADFKVDPANSKHVRGGTARGQVAGCIALAAIVAAFALVSYFVSLRKNIEYDGVSFLFGGFIIKRTGNPDIGLEHPHGLRLLLAYALDDPKIKVPITSEVFDTHSRGWKGLDELYRLSERFQAENPTFDALRLRASCLMIVIHSLGLVAFFVVVRGVANNCVIAILLTAALASLPAWLAHAGMATSDLIMVDLLIATFAAYRKAHATGSTRWHVVGSALASLALVTRFLAAPFYLGVLVWTIFRKGLRVSRRLAEIFFCFALPLLATWAVYRFDSRPYTANLLAEDLEEFFPNSSASTREAIRTAVAYLPFPTLFLRTVLAFCEHAGRGHPSYFFGEVSWHGRWPYFPAVFALKTPLPTLCVIVVSVIVAAGLAVHAVRKSPSALFQHAWIFGPLLAIALFLTARVNEGQRHILSWYPMGLICVAVAGRHWPGWIRLVLSLCVAYQVGIAANEFPHYLPFTDYVWGGPACASRYLGNSNVDVGKDLHELERMLESRGISSAVVRYWGKAIPKRNTRVTMVLYDPRLGWPAPGTILALSEGLRTYEPKLLTRMEPHLRPLFHVGYSIRVYEVVSEIR